MNEHWRGACASATLTEGTPQRCRVDNLDLLLVRVAGVVYALSNLCTHADACLHEGRVRGNRIICPLHGASFDARTGAVLAKPATEPLRRYEVRETDGNIFILIASPPA
jgi:nitrite reductase/ring-hydroxylating ferredoxin subunit